MANDTITLIDVFMSKREGHLITIDRPRETALFMLKNKRYSGQGLGRYAPIEEKDRWFEFEEEEPKKVPLKKTAKEDEAEIEEVKKPVKKTRRKTVKPKKSEPKADQDA